MDGSGGLELLVEFVFYVLRPFLYAAYKIGGVPGMIIFLILLSVWIGKRIKKSNERAAQEAEDLRAKCLTSEALYRERIASEGVDEEWMAKWEPKIAALVERVEERERERKKGRGL
jgi:hypothetical protein